MKKVILLLSFFVGLISLTHAQTWSYEKNTITSSSIDTTYFYPGSDSTLQGAAEFTHFGVMKWQMFSDSVSGSTSATTLIQGTNAEDPDENDWTTLATHTSNGATRVATVLDDTSCTWYRLRARTITANGSQNTALEHHVTFRRRQ